MTKTVSVHCNGKDYEFLIRTESGYDTSVTNALVIREIFEENVYQVKAGDVAGTGVVVDIGGNVGTFSIYCAALGAKKVYTYEPDSLNWEVLVENMQRNDLWRVVEANKLAVFSEEGAVELYQGQGASFLHGAKCLVGDDIQTRLLEAGHEVVRTITLDQVFADIAECDILKLDCEGSEYPIIAAADSETLAKARYITMEFHGTDADTFGRMVSKLTHTHNTHIIGHHGRGGQVYARRY